MIDCHVEGQDLFTLVTYTPDPLRNWLINLRRLLAVPAGCQPHITLLPPRPLTTPVEQARQTITSILGRWHSFEVELSGVCVFPGSNFLYLEVAEGSDELRSLHAQLNAGDFAHKELFEFHPHVTVGGPVPPEQVEGIARKAAEAWQKSGRPWRVQIDEVAFVSMAANDKGEDGRRLWMYKLEPKKARRRAAGAALTSQTF